MRTNKHKAIIAMDFDNCLAIIGTFPTIIGLKPGAKAAMEELFRKNYYVIVWTCREGLNLNSAKQFLLANGVPFHQINTHHPELVQRFGTDTRKICADIYVDDKNLEAHKLESYPNYDTLVADIEAICNDVNFKSVL
jgi:hypothetical protein